MKNFLLLSFIMSFQFILADIHHCEFEVEGNQYELMMTDLESGRKAIELIINDDVEVVDIFSGETDPDSHGDGWSQMFSSPTNPNKFEVFYDADYITAVYISTRYLDNYKVESCREI